jgi:hypothetical protein
VTDEARRPEDHQACAHLRVLYATEQIEGGRTRGWWACDSCRAKFTPVASAEHAVAQARERYAKVAAEFDSDDAPSEDCRATARIIAEAIRREPQPAQPPPGPPGGHALQFLPGREPIAFDYGKIGVTCGCGRTPVHSTVDPTFHPEEA